MFDQIKKNFNLFIIALLIFSIPSVIGLLHSGFPLTDDGNWMVIRLSAFYENLRDGQFPVRFLSRLNHGYGYPVADFLYPGFMYIGSLIHILGFSFVNSVKIILGLSLILSAVFSFFWLRKSFGQVPALVGSLVYLYFPYHLYDVYNRGSVGEVLALAVLPFILWQIEKRNIFWSAIGIFLLILAHNTLAVLFILFIFTYMGFDVFVSKNRKQLLYRYTSISVLGFGMSAFFWIPAVFDLKYTVFFQTEVSDWSKYFADISLIGILPPVVLTAALLLFLIRKKTIKTEKFPILFFLIGTISLFMANSLSFIFWNFLPVSFIQFPFRFLSLTIISVSFLSAFAISAVSKNNKIIFSLFILVLTFSGSLLFILPKNYQFYPDSFYFTNQDTTTVKNEYMPLWVKKIPNSMYESKVQNINGEEKINVKEVSPNRINFQVYLPQKRTIAVNTIYFPGWTAFVNGKLSEIYYDNPNGIIELKLEKGENNVSIYFTETFVRQISNLISLLSFGSLFIMLYFIKFKKIKI